MLTVNGNASVVYQNTTNAEAATSKLICSETRILTFPVGTTAQRSETRYNRGNRQLELEAGTYSIVVERENDTDYTIYVSDIIE